MKRTTAVPSVHCTRNTYYEGYSGSIEGVKRIEQEWRGGGGVSVKHDFGARVDTRARKCQNMSKY